MRVVEEIVRGAVAVERERGRRRRRRGGGRRRRPETASRYFIQGTSEITAGTPSLYFPPFLSPSLSLSLCQRIVPPHSSRSSFYESASPSASCALDKSLCSQQTRGRFKILPRQPSARLVAARVTPIPSPPRREVARVEATLTRDEEKRTHIPVPAVRHP